jgi:hypothetical protein
MYKNAMSDYACSAVPGVQYAPYQFTMRKILETNDFNGDGVHNTQDARDGFDANPQGYPVDKIIPVIARSEGNTDSLTAMVAEIAPVAPTHIYRTNSYDDMIPGGNLYAANSQIKRNNAQNYCARYWNVANNFGDSANFGIQKNYDIMVNYSTHPTGLNYGFIQHIPELDLLKVSVFRDNTNAFDLPMTSFDLRDFFNREPQFTSQPVDTARVGEVYNYLVEVSDPDPYDIITFSANQLPSCLTLTDNGDGTALLHGTPDQAGIEPVSIKASDGMIEISQEFELTIDNTTGMVELSNFKCELYPNPFTEYINVITNRQSYVRIFSLDGSEQYEGLLRSASNRLDLSLLSKGVYVVVLDDGTRRTTHKIIKR